MAVDALWHAPSRRQHQIRVHTAHLGAPVANDDIYGDDANAFRAEARRIHDTPCHASQGLRTEHSFLPLQFAPLRRGRPLLHAWSLRVSHPEQASAQHNPG